MSADEQTAEEPQYAATAQGDYRKAADEIRKVIDQFSEDENRQYRLSHAYKLAELAIRMTAAQHGTGLAAVDMPQPAQEQ